MNIFFREIKAYRKSLIIWCSAIIFMIVSGMGKYAGLSASGQSINEFISKMPKSLQAIMGLSSIDISEAIGYYGLLYMFLVVMSSIHALMLGAGIISKEEIDKTAEFLMVKPVSRYRIATAKLSAAFVNILILNLITLIFSFVIVKRYSNGKSVFGEIVLLMAGMFILQLIFMLIGTVIAAGNKNPKTATSLAGSILLITFILSKLIDVVQGLYYLKYFTPFKYFDAKDLLGKGRIDPQFIVLSTLIILILLSATYMFYKNRDLNI